MEDTVLDAKDIKNYIKIIDSANDPWKRAITVFNEHIQLSPISLYDDNNKTFNESNCIVKYIIVFKQN